MLHLVFEFDDDRIKNNGVTAFLIYPSFANFAKVVIDNNYIRFLENVFNFNCKYFLTKDLPTVFVSYIRKNYDRE